MAMLKRQRIDSPIKVFSARLPEKNYNNLVDFAFSKRFTLSAAVTYLLEKALDAENDETNTQNESVTGKSPLSQS